MATTFKNALSPNIGTTPIIVYTAGTNVKVTVLGISLSNNTSSFVTVSVIVTDPTPSGTIVGTVANASNTITNVNSFSELSTGSVLTGAYIPANTTVLGLNNTGQQSTSTITMSATATGAATEQITFTSSTPVSAYYVNNVILPPNQSIRVINGGERLVLGASNTLSIVSNTASSVDAVVSLVEIV